MGLVHWFCNLSPIVTVCMQAQTHGSSQQAESASWVITTISMADGACALVLQLKPHCHCMHASTNPWQLTANRECLLGNNNHLYDRWGLCIVTVCMQAQTHGSYITASRECLLGNYNHLFGRWGLCIGFAT